MVATGIFDLLSQSSGIFELTVQNVFHIGMCQLQPIVRRIYFAVELYSFSFSRKYCSEFMVSPLADRII
jgi:hypothetical protein